jgi:2-methylcitrate dehydratase PrpD
MNISRQFAANIVHTDFNSLDETAVERARYHILDPVGCFVAEANAPGSRATLAVVKKWGGV